MNVSQYKVFPGENAVSILRQHHDIVHTAISNCLELEDSLQLATQF